MPDVPLSTIARQDALCRWQQCIRRETCNHDDDDDDNDDDVKENEVIIAHP